jgi:peptidoglycan/LPS O-acetylase OafA/YrhL
MSAPGDRHRAIDQMRGVAILLVVIYHAGPLAWRLAPYRSDGWLAWPRLGLAWLAVPWLHFGFTGVHAFFVLSGLCIHLRVARGGRLALRGFFLRRFWRIYPPYWIALGLFAVGVPLAAGALGQAVAPPTAGDLALHATMLHTLETRTFFSINPAFWSLATEEQFYLAYPLVVLALARFGMRRVLVASLALSLAWRAAVLVALPPTVENFLAYRVLVHGLFLPRWFEWLLGCWLAERMASPAPSLGARRLAAAGVALLALGMASRVHVVADKLCSDALFAGGFAALTGALLAVRAPVGAVGAVLAAVGRRAYGLYLVHQPALDWLALPLGGRLMLALGGGALFSRIFERPFEKRSQQVAAAARASGYGVT